ncbi:MAG: NUDIX domain-containing protein [Paracoccaceae bacterium]
MPAVFLCGPLCYRPLLDEILTVPEDMQDAFAAGLQGLSVPAPGAFALIPQADSIVQGLLIASPSDEALARLAFFAEAIGLVRQPVRIRTAQLVDLDADCFSAEPSDGTSWTRDDWRGRGADLATETAKAVMSVFGTTPAAAVHGRLGSIMVRAASKLRAIADTRPHLVRRDGGQIDLISHRQPYAHFFAVEEFDLSFARFDGSMSPVITRAAFVSADAVTVLPYDPVRDRVLVVEQFRAGPYGRGDPNPWQLEAIAGRIDPGESPEDCARREALEEAALTLGTLLLVANYYPSPGAKTEYIYAYVALTDLPDGAAGVYGLEDEAEDIRGHLIDFAQLLDLVCSGEVQNGPLLMTALWLQRERHRLRA